MEATNPVSTLSLLFSMSLFEQGGPVMYVLLAAAVVGLTYVIYCLLVLRRGAVMSRSLVDVAENYPGGLGADEALAICRREGGSFAEILVSVIATRELPRSEAEGIVEGAGRRAAHDLSRGTLALEVVSGISTLLGLLGTVTGMFNMMVGIREAGIKDIGAISGGIGEALITTIAGLFIAIPTYVAFVYFGRRVEDLVLMMEEYAILMLARVHQEQAEAASAFSTLSESPAAVLPSANASSGAPVLPAKHAPASPNAPALPHDNASPAASALPSGNGAFLSGNGASSSGNEASVRTKSGEAKKRS